MHALYCTVQFYLPGPVQQLKKTRLSPYVTFNLAFNEVTEDLK
jgi:hypothetical protein